MNHFYKYLLGMYNCYGEIVKRNFQIFSHIVITVYSDIIYCVQNKQLNKIKWTAFSKGINIGVCELKRNVISIVLGLKTNECVHSANK